VRLFGDSCRTLQWETMSTLQCIIVCIAQEEERKGEREVGAMKARTRHTDFFFLSSVSLSLSLSFSLNIRCACAQRR